MAATTRSLRLRREALSELSTDDLAGVAGGDYRWSADAITCGLLRCVEVDDTIDPSPLTRLTLDSRYCYTTPYC